MRKIFVAAIVGLIICAGVKAEAAEIFVGRSPATGFDCYVLTNTIDRYNEERMVITSVTLKMIDSHGDDYYLDYKFFALDGGDDDVQFTNSDGYKGMVDEYNTPIEWAIYAVTKDY
ncbi:MAG: hypothetical protein SR3Q1_04350 [Quinella sp. 3Q1]|nr:hypothetical protein [Quinella sp. 3Q1]MBR6888086.1 hypothetical protein [Selenomonadaceae bacterium]